jgi:metal-responsive CopG/Arc/MetJ family transcriptional regulator
MLEYKRSTEDNLLTRRLMIHTKYISLRMPDALCSQIDAEASEKLLSRADIIRAALLLYFKQQSA